MPVKPEFYTPKEILAAVNNALLAIRREKTIAVLSQDRIRYLRAYTGALGKPLFEHVEEGALTGQELLFVMLGLSMQALLKVAYPGGALPQGAYKMLSGEDE